jgi:vacuolar-type H+-ATPase subunit H
MVENMENNELEIINHLLEVEKGASSLIDEAQLEAEKTILDAKTKYNKEYKEKYDSIVTLLEEDYKKELQKADEKHQKEMDDYKKELESKEIKTKEFNDFLDKEFFA